jgi:hypothetical protein
MKLTELFVAELDREADGLVDALDKHVAKARESLSKANDEFLLTTNWRLLVSGKVMRPMSRGATKSTSAHFRRLVGSGRCRWGAVCNRAGSSMAESCFMSRRTRG